MDGVGTKEDLPTSGESELPDHSTKFNWQLGEKGKLLLVLDDSNFG